MKKPNQHQNFPKMDEIAKFGWKYYISMDVNHFLSKKLMNVGICDYTKIAFVANLAFLQNEKKKNPGVYHNSSHF
jgi:hypothetical protein